MLASYIAVMMSDFKNSDVVVEESDLQDEKDYGAIWRKHMIAAMCLYLFLHVLEVIFLYLLTAKLQLMMPIIHCAIYLFIWNKAIYGATIPLILLSVGAGMGLYSSYNLFVMGTLGGFIVGTILLLAAAYSCWVYLFARRE